MLALMGKTMVKPIKPIGLGGPQLQENAEMLADRWLRWPFYCQVSNTATPFSDSSRHRDMHGNGARPPMVNAWSMDQPYRRAAYNPHKYHSDG